MEYRVVDYLGHDGVWKNTDQGDPEPLDSEIEGSPEVNLGFVDQDGNWHYRWVDGPFDEDFWLDDAAEQVADRYGYVIGN